MIRYESDSQAIARALSALGEGEIIDHGTARAIAAGYNTPGIVASFVSIGALVSGTTAPGCDVLREMLQGVDARTVDDDREALTALMAYLRDRDERYDIDRIDDWSDMRVAAHVDYPHENGALDTCWCYEDDDTED